jgi:alpha-tubulin suppressor-like RCC1 family protein
MKRKLIAITLITVLICVGSGNIVGCAPTSATEYDLTIDSTAGGSVTVPGEGAFICSPGAVVGLVAEADEGYRFVNWTGDVGTIGNVTAAATTITMNDNYSITANFIALYDLTIASTAGGSVTTPGEGVFTYDEGTVVNLIAEPDAGYLFSSWTGDVGTITNVNAAATTITMSSDYSITANFGWFNITQVSTFGWHMVGLKSDHIVLAVGWNDYGQCGTGNWTDITQVTAGYLHTVGLKSGGTVVAVGENTLGQCDVGNWTDITQVAAGGYHTVGVKSDDTVVAVGANAQGQCNVGNWTDITQVAGGYLHTVGVKSDGTVVAVGADPIWVGGFSWHYGQCEVGNWTDITQVATYYFHTVGLKDDGTVVAVGNNTQGQCDVDSWTGIIQVAAGFEHTVGLKSDGTVVAVGNNDYGQCDVGGWTDIIQVAAGYVDTVGLKSDGTVVTVGPSYDV